MMAKYKCTHGHARCFQMSACPECPTCERVVDCDDAEFGMSDHRDRTAPCDDAEVMRLWRECDLPEYFLGNGGTNHKLVSFANACQRSAAEQPFSQSRADMDDINAARAQIETLRRRVADLEDFLRGAAKQFTQMAQ